MPKPIIIGVAGGTGSGKTTVSEAILRRVGTERIAYIQHDSYYRDLSHLSLEQRAQVNFDHPASLDNELLVEHLDALLRGAAVQVPIYDFATHNRLAEARLVEPRPVILVEGILIFAEAALRERMRIKIYVDTDADLRFIRRLRRDTVERSRSISSVIDQYLHTVRPMHLEFVEPTKRYADIIIPRGGRNAIAIDMVVARVAVLGVHPEGAPDEIVRVPGEELDLSAVEE
jgi:uridine kinase